MAITETEFLTIAKNGMTPVWVKTEKNVYRLWGCEKNKSSEKLIVFKPFSQWQIFFKKEGKGLSFQTLTDLVEHIDKNKIEYNPNPLNLNA